MEELQTYIYIVIVALAWGILFAVARNFFKK